MKDGRILVLSREGWCRAAKKKTLRYQDSVKTACGYFIVEPFGFKEEGKPTCFACQCVEKKSEEAK